MRAIKTSLAILPILAFLLIPIAAADNRFVTTLAFIFIVYTTVALSWNIIGGMAGQLNLGHAAFFGLGAYSMAVSTSSGLHPYLGVPPRRVGGSRPEHCHDTVIKATWRLFCHRNFESS
jgi:branched-chain amino acid transport system permease protein